MRDAAPGCPVTAGAVRDVSGREVVGFMGKKAKPNYAKSSPKPLVKRPAPKKQPWT